MGQRLINSPSLPQQWSRLQTDLLTEVEIRNYRKQRNRLERLVIFLESYNHEVSRAKFRWWCSIDAWVASRVGSKLDIRALVSAPQQMPIWPQDRHHSSLGLCLHYSSWQGCINFKDFLQAIPCPLHTKYSSFNTTSWFPLQMAVGATQLDSLTGLQCFYPFSHCSPSCP